MCSGICDLLEYLSMEDDWSEELTNTTMEYIKEHSDFHKKSLKHWGYWYPENSVVPRREWLRQRIKSLQKLQKDYEEEDQWV